MRSPRTPSCTFSQSCPGLPVDESTVRTLGRSREVLGSRNSHGEHCCRPGWEARPERPGRHARGHPDSPPIRVIDATGERDALPGPQGERFNIAGAPEERGPGSYRRMASPEAK